MNDLTSILFRKVWWQYDVTDTSWFSIVYHWFNIAEGVAWVVFAILVLMRFSQHRKSKLELWYAFTFLLFGITDFREAWQQSSPLIWIKLLILIALLWLRKVVLTKFYQEAKLF